MCFYNRILTQAEVREQMHLVKSTETALKGYFQFNETNNVIWNKVDANFANFSGTATRATSTAPVGTGTSQRMTVTTSGVKDFATQHLSLEFPSSGTYPNGELVVTELANSPDQTPSVGTALTGKYWIINNYGTNSSFSALTNLQLSNLGSYATGTAANFKLYKRSSTADGATWGSSLCGATALTTANNNTLTFGSSCNITSFSQIEISREGALAVELLDFRAVWKAQQVEIAWKVSNERDVAHYEVERSFDGQSFNALATVNAGQFSVLDAAAFTGVQYYRLKIVERDGHSTYSSVQSVAVQLKSDFHIYPNPTSDLLNVEFQSASTQTIEIELVNALGQTIQRYAQASDIGENRFTLSMGGQISGLYTLRLVQGRQVYMQRVCLR
ncbi:MAG: hypothetical protein RLZZ628_38 [Bacteroidota bacterium]